MTRALERQYEPFCRPESFAAAKYLKTFLPDQLHTLALVALKLHGDSYAISLVFFRFARRSLGYLILKSGFLSRTICVLMGIAGACYLINSFSHLIAPAFGATLFPGARGAQLCGGVLACRLADRKGRECREVGRESEHRGGNTANNAFPWDALAVRASCVAVRGRYAGFGALCARYVDGWWTHGCL